MLQAAVFWNTFLVTDWRNTFLTKCYHYLTTFYYHRKDTLTYLTAIYLDKADTRVHFQMNHGSAQYLKRIVHRRGQYLFYSL